MCQRQTTSAPRGWVSMLRDFVKHVASWTTWAIDVTLDLSMQIASLTVRAKVAFATEVSVVAEYSCAVDG